MSTTSAEDVLQFWFGADTDEPKAVEERFQLWFAPEPDPEFDRALDAAFQQTVESARRNELTSWSDSARGSLALIILLDQIPRNIYRGTDLAFRSDELALAMTNRGILRGFDEQLTLIERVFFYIPLEHAEDLTAQDRCVAYYTALDALATEDFRGITQQCIEGSSEHRDVIRRFGRFPQRNRVLGRVSTDAELGWLDQHHGWGQAAPAPVKSR